MPPKKKPTKVHMVNKDNKDKKVNKDKKQRRKTKPQFLVCPDTGDAIWITTATLQDIQYAAKKGKHPYAAARKYLVTVPSPTVRKQIYETAARALEDLETRVLPEYGGRPWRCVVTVKDASESPYFVWHKADLEVAAWPHIVAKMPDPPRFPGYSAGGDSTRRPRVAVTAAAAAAAGDNNDNDEPVQGEAAEESHEVEPTPEEVHMHDLQEREWSSVSQMAWAERWRVPLPVVAIKWISPIHQIFHTRKSAWENAVLLCKQEVLLDKVLLGYGSNGQPVKVQRPSKAMGLKAGKARFQRDGLWVVGQEEAWQNERLLEEEPLNTKNRLGDNAVEAEGMSSKAKRPHKMSGLPLYIQCHRKEHRDKRLAELRLRLAAKESSTTTTTTTTTTQLLWVKPPSVVNHVECTTSGEKHEPVEPPSVVDHVECTTSGEKPEPVEPLECATSGEKPERVEPVSLVDHSECTTSGEKPELVELLSVVDHVECTTSGDKPAPVEPLSVVYHTECATNGEKPEPVKHQSLVGHVECATSGEKPELVELLSVVDHVECTTSGDKPEPVEAPSVECTTSGGKPATVEPLSVVYHTECATNGEKPEPVEHLSLVGHVECATSGEKLKESKSVSVEHKKAENKPSASEKQESAAKPGKEVSAQAISFTLRDADRELRLLWKDLTDEERQGWEGARSEKQDGSPQDKRVESMNLSSKELALGKSIKTDDKLPSVGRVSPYSSESGVDDTIVSSSADISADKNSTDTSDFSVKVEAKAHVDETEPANTSVVTSCPSSNADAIQNKSESSDNATVTVQEPRTTQTVAVTPAPIQKTLKASMATSVSMTATCPRESKTLFDSSTHWRLNEQQVKLCHDAGMDHFNQVMVTVKARGLVRELQDGFDLLRERGRGRYDMELPTFDTPEFRFLTDLKKAPWMPIVREILGKDVALIHKGMFLSLPGAERQDYHQDGPHLTTQFQKPCHAVNVFVPLVDLSMKNGPTEFCLASHILGHEEYDEDFVETPVVSAGTPVIFDYRLGHRGLRNSSDACRPILYCTYAAAADGKEFRDSVNFSRKRYHRIGDLVSKGPSRDERKRKREQIVAEEQIEVAKSEFRMSDGCKDYSHSL